jgi:hypothetical protein
MRINLMWRPRYSIKFQSCVCCPSSNELGQQTTNELFRKRAFQVERFAEWRQRVFRYRHVFGCQRVVVMKLLQLAGIFQLAFHYVIGIGTVRHVYQIDLVYFIPDKNRNHPPANTGSSPPI